MHPCNVLYFMIGNMASGGPQSLDDIKKSPERMYLNNYMKLHFESYVVSNAKLILNLGYSTLVMTHMYIIMFLRESFVYKRTIFILIIM